MLPGLQEWIHRLEVGEGTRWVRAIACVLALAGLAALYDARAFRNLSRPEAMDAAQVGRNVARGQGFTTQFIRPLSIHLVESRAQTRGAGNKDLGRLQQPHPDLANPPLYPLLLGAFMRAVQMDFDVAPGARFQVHRPDLQLALLNQGLFVVLVVLVYGLARRLFDDTVAWIAAAVVACTDLFWRFTVSGLSTLLGLVVVTGLAWCLVAIDRAARAGRGVRRLVWLAGVAGALTAAAGLTVYALLWLIVPVVGLLATCCPGRRLLLPGAALVVFLGVLAPWLARNYAWSGNVLGTASYSLLADTPAFPENSLDRTLDPKTTRSMLRSCGRKLVGQGAGLLRDLPRLTGSWVSAFFLVGLMVRFADPVRGRLRVFVVGTLGILGLVQALTSQQSPAEQAELTGQNLVVFLVPMILIFGCALFAILLDQLPWTLEGARQLALAILLVVAAAPLVATLLPPRPSPLTHPPYHPPLISQFGQWFRPDELTMSDIPWAVAWYGDRRCVWTPRLATSVDGREDFYAVNDERRTVSGLYLSPVTLDSRFFADMFAARAQRLVLRARAAEAGGATDGEDRSLDVGWGELAMMSLVETNLPPGFPLKSGHGDFAVNGHLVLTDRFRWSRTGGAGIRSGSGPRP